VLIGAPSIARPRSHYSVDGTMVVSGAGQLLLETDNAGPMSSVTVAAIIAAAIVSAAIGASTVVTSAIAIVSGTVSITISVRIIAIAVRVSVAIAEEGKTSYEHETGVAAVAMIPVATVE